METKDKAKEIINYIMCCCDCNRTQGTPYKEMVKEVAFFIDND